MSHSYSIRNSLQGELKDFLFDAGFTCSHTADLVRDLTALLAAYREEDTPLFPAVFIMSSAEDLGLVAPGTRPVSLGKLPIEADNGARILKECGPLAVNGWSIYAHRCSQERTFEYGLFRSHTNTLATSALEAMESDTAGSAIVSIRNRGHLVVELRTSSQEIFTASLTSAPANPSDFATHISMLSAAIARDVPSTESEGFEAYLRRFLEESLLRCHGTLCAVIPPPEDTPPEFSQSTWLSEPLLWADALVEARSTSSSDELAHLQSIEALIAGMINCDGVVVFATDGTVRAYRAFLNPNDEERVGLPSDGGGRRRTFGLMKGRLGTNLHAVFFRSQDGASACERSNA